MFLLTYLRPLIVLIIIFFFHKLNFNYNFSVSSINLLKSYLIKRSQIVDFNGTLSNPDFNKCGVPQGTKLGPLFFLIYINDIKNFKLISKIYGFADDLTLVSKGKMLMI